MKSRCIIDLLIIILIFSTGCSQKPGEPKPFYTSVAKTIHVGMNLSLAETILKESGSKETMYQMALVRNDRNRKLHYFKLPSGRVISFISENGEHKTRKISSMSISTYEPKSWNSKLDTERKKFFDSFKQINEYKFK